MDLKDYSISGAFVLLWIKEWSNDFLRDYNMIWWYRGFSYNTVLL